MSLSPKRPKTSHHSLDEIDNAILSMLQRSARATNSEIGEAVGLSPSAVSRRIQALEDQGIIVGYQAVLDESVMGRGITVFIRVTLEKQSATALNSFESAIRRWNGAVFCYLMAGQYDYMLQIKVADIADYERLHRKELSTLPGVARLESSFSVRDVAGLGVPAKTARNAGRQTSGRSR
jgi:Lrp/AsnC family leucine-responsive transcriptional regulator